MADAVTTKVLADGPRNYAVVLTNVSDGTGESAVQKIDKSTLVGPNGNEPDNLVLVRAAWSIQGFEGVQIIWDHTADVTALVLAGDNYDDWSMYGGYHDGGSGGSGDILLTTIGTPAANDTYNITLHFKKQGG